jgi:hypothetical protein
MSPAVKGIRLHVYLTSFPSILTTTFNQGTPSESDLEFVIQPFAQSNGLDLINSMLPNEMIMEIFQKFNYLFELRACRLVLFTLSLEEACVYVQLK